MDDDRYATPNSDARTREIELAVWFETASADTHVSKSDTTALQAKVDAISADIAAIRAKPWRWRPAD